MTTQTEPEAFAKPDAVRTSSVSDPLSELFEHAPIAMQNISAEGIVLAANEAGCAMLGFAPAEFIGTNIASCYTDQPDLEDIIGALSRGETIRNRPGVMLAKDGTQRRVLISSTGVFDNGKLLHSRCFIRDVTDEANAREQIEEHVRLAAFVSDVQRVLAESLDVDAMLQSCAEVMVGHLDAAFARVWTLDESADALHLRASAGKYTDLHGSHAMIPIGAFKIGRIAQSLQPHMTNAVMDDPQVSDQEWARREGMVSFAGYPLVDSGRLRGVMAMFARAPLSDATLESMASVASAVAVAITRREAEAALAGSEHRYRTLTESAPLFVWTVAEGGVVDYFNDHWFRYSGLTPEQAYGHGWEAVLHPDDLPLFTKRRHVGASDHFSVEGRLRRADGIYRWHAAQVVPIEWRAGVAVRWLGTAVDIDDRKRAEDALSLSEARYRALTDGMAAYVSAATVAGAVLYYNQQWLEYTGRTMEDLLSGGWAHHVDAQGIARLTANFADANASGRAYETEYRARRADGVYRWFVSRTVPVKNEHDDVVMWIDVAIDIEDRKHAEAEREELVASLQSAMSAKDDFLGLVSHELRTPITTILGNAEILRRKGESLDAETRAGAIEDVALEAERLVQIVDNLMALARVESGERLQVEPVPLPRIIERAVARHQRRHPDREVRAEAPAVGAPVICSADAVEQVLRNLLSNAEKFSPPGSPIEVSATLAPDGSMVRLTVSDSGRGFPEEESEAIFTPFHRPNTASGGAGIGLAVCRRLIEAQGGVITASPRPGGGSIFAFTLPLSDSGEAA